MIDENTSRADLEDAAIFECDFSIAFIKSCSDDDLREAIVEWVFAGDECASC